MVFFKKTHSVDIPVYAMKACWEVEGELHSSLIAALDAGAWSTVIPTRFKYGETGLGTFWMGTRNGQVRVERRKVCCSDRRPNRSH